MAGDPYKRQQFNSGVTQKANNNFARFDRAVQVRQKMKEKVAAQKKANNGTFSPTPITEKINSEFSGQKTAMNTNVMDVGVKYGPSLDPKSDKYNPTNLATYNNLKGSTLAGIQKMNEAFTSYDTIMQGYKSGALDFTEEEYEDIQSRWAKVNEFTQNPDRLGYDDRGNVTVAVYNEETNEDEQILLNDWDVLTFTDALGAQKEPDYLANFEKLVGSSADNFNDSFDDAIIKNGGWESPDNVGAMTDWIEATSPNATPEGIALMLENPKYREEYKQWVVSERQNAEKDPRDRQTSTNPNKPIKSPIMSIIKIDAKYTNDLKRNPDGTIKDDTNLRSVIDLKIDGDWEANQEAFDDFMKNRTGKGPGEYTKQELEDAWVEHATLEVAPYNDINKDLTAAGGWIDPEVKGVGSVSKVPPRNTGEEDTPTVSGDRRYNSGDEEGQKFDKNKRDTYQSTFADPTGQQFFSYNLLGSGSRDFPDLAVTIEANNGTFVSGMVGSITVNKKQKDDNISHHGLAGESTFQPQSLMNNVPMLSRAYDFKTLSTINKQRTNFFTGNKTEGSYNENLMKGAILSNEMIDILKEELGSDWQNYVNYKPAFYGTAKMTESGTEYATLIPATAELMNDLQTKTNHNFKQMTNPVHFVKDLEMEQLLDLYNGEFTPEATRNAASARIVELNQNN